MTWLREICGVVPLDAEQSKDLRERGIPHPEPLANPPGPTPRQVLAALESLPWLEYEVQQRPGRAAAMIPARRADDPAQATEVQLWRIDHEDAPCQVTFAGGPHPLLREIAEAIAVQCGPLVLFSAMNTDLLVVCEGHGGST